MSTKKGPALELPYIVEDLRTLAIPIDEPVLDPANARTGHDVDRIAQSLAVYHQRVPIVVNVNQNNKVEKGNGTLLAARKLGWTHIAAIRVKDDPMTAAGFGIADNRVGDLSTWDLETLRTLLDSMDDEVFTGFSPEEIDDLMADMDDLLEEATPAGTPVDGLVPQNDRYREQYGVIVVCEDELGQEETYNTLKSMGYNCRVVVT